MPVFYYVFDVLWLDGCDVRTLELRERKRLLRRTLHFGGGVRWTPYRRRDGRALFEHACRAGWEGLIAKRLASPYTDRRSRDWLKFKCEHGQELVIGGYTEPHGSRVEFGALLVGYYDDGALRYAGQGRDRLRRGDAARHRPAAARARAARARRSPTRRSSASAACTGSPPSSSPRSASASGRRHGRLRHPRFLGLRDDKSATDVVARAMSETLRIGRRTVEISHPDKALFAHPPVTKRDLAHHYGRVADAMLPHVRGRPLALEVFPEGIERPASS